MPALPITHCNTAFINAFRLQRHNTHMPRPLRAGYHLAAALLLASLPIPSHAPADNLANNVVLIIRHAEKPTTGTALTPAGQARAQAYTHYFEPFREDGLTIPVDALYAGADSGSSIRPRLTLEPLSHTTGLPLDTTVSTKSPDQLVTLLHTQPHGTHPLIAWRHGQIPALLTAFGASPALLPNGKWPDDTYDWVIVLRFDATGKLQSQHLVKERLSVPAN